VAGSIIQTVPPVETGTMLVRESGQYALLTPPVLELAEVFYTAYHRPIDMGTEGLWTVPATTSLVWEVTADGVASQQYFRGLAPLVAAELRRRGYRMRQERKPLAALPEPDLREAANHGNDPSVLQFIHGHERGVIRYGSSVKIECLVAQVAAAWPSHRIVAVATRKADAVSLHNRLAASAPGVGLLLPHRAWPSATRVLVATPAALGLGPAAIEHRDLYLALNPDELFSTGWMQTAMQGIRHLWRARLFGFLPAGKGLPPLRRDYVQALFGSDEHMVPAHGHTHRTVRVAFVPVTGGLQPGADDSAYVVLRDAVHRHGLRNRLICKLADALMATDLSGIERQYPTIASLLNPVRRRVAVYVDNFDHGLKLAHSLRLPLVTDIVCGKSRLSDADISWLDRGVEYEHHGTQAVVVTTGGLRHIGPFDVLVRADAGTGALPLPAKHLRNAAGEDRNLVVIDIKDAHVPALRHRSRLRRLAYREAGWTVVGEPSLTPLEHFKATRPEVFK